MRTFAIMFLILSILNVPIYLIYQAPTDDNVYDSSMQFWSYFTLGNLARPNEECGYSDVREYLVEDFDGHSPNINLKCDKGYISKLMFFGLLYKDDKRTGKESNGYSQCHAVEYP